MILPIPKDLPGFEIAARLKDLFHRRGEWAGYLRNYHGEEDSPYSIPLEWVRADESFRDNLLRIVKALLLKNVYEWTPEALHELCCLIECMKPRPDQIVENLLVETEIPGATNHHRALLHRTIAAVYLRETKEEKALDLKYARWVVRGGAR